MDLPDPEELRQLMEALEQMQTNKPDPESIQLDLEANDLRARAFVEGLSDQQVEDLLWLVSGMASEGTGNYATFTMRGLLLGETWHRKPLGSVGLEEIGDGNG